MKKMLIGIIVDGKAGGVDKYILDFYRVAKDNAKVDFLSNFDTPKLRKELEENGSKLFTVSSLKNPLKQYKQAKKIIMDNNYDIVYMNISTSLTFPVLKAAHDCKVKSIVAHSHSAGYDCQNDLNRKIMTFLHKLCKNSLCRNANIFLTCSQKAAEWLFTKKIAKSKKVITIQNKIDTTKFTFNGAKRDEIRKSLKITDKFVIGNVGNMVYQKNQEFLIEVFKSITEKSPDAVLVIIGDGILMGKIKQKIADYGLQEKVLLLGKVNASDGYMSAFDVFALPSHFEGMPIVSVEAQCSSLPCVFSDKITKEAEISNMCKFLPITNAELWAESILSFKNTNRSDMKLTKDLSNFDTNNKDDLILKSLSLQ